MGRRQLIAIAVMAVAVAGSGLAALGLRVLPEAPTAASSSAQGVPTDASHLSTPLALTPGGVGATRRSSSTAPGSGHADPSHSAGTTGGASGGSSKAVLAGRIKPGDVHHGVATFYDADGGGNCMFDPTDDLMVAAMNHTDYENSAACGAYLRVTGPRGDSVTVRVTDQCAKCPVGALDLSAQAFAKLASPSVGRISINWELISPRISEPVSLRYKSGSSRYWCAVQVLNHRNPVAKLEFRVRGAWRSIPRQDYNYFLSASGAGCGSQVRVTDIYGQVITVRGLELTPEAVQTGPAQFTRR